MVDNDLSDEFKAVGEAVKNLAHKANAISGEQINSIIEVVKDKLTELGNLLEAQRTKHSSE